MQNLALQLAMLAPILLSSTIPTYLPEVATGWARACPVAKIMPSLHGRFNQMQRIRGSPAHAWALLSVVSYVLDNPVGMVLWDVPAEVHKGEDGDRILCASYRDLRSRTAPRQPFIPVSVSSNRIRLQELRPIDAGVLTSSARQGERDLSMELSVTSSLRMQAVRATLFGLPAGSRRPE